MNIEEYIEFEKWEEYTFKGKVIGYGYGKGKLIKYLGPWKAGTAFQTLQILEKDKVIKLYKKGQLPVEWNYETKEVNNISLNKERLFIERPSDFINFLKQFPEGTIISSAPVSFPCLMKLVMKQDVVKELYVSYFYPDEVSFFKEKE